MVATRTTGFKSAYERAGLWSRIAFSWPQPLIDKGWHNLVLEANDARFLMPNDTDADALANDFESAYSRLKVCGVMPHRSRMTRPRRVPTDSFAFMYRKGAASASQWLLCLIMRHHIGLAALLQCPVL